MKDLIKRLHVFRRHVLGCLSRASTFMLGEVGAVKLPDMPPKVKQWLDKNRKKAIIYLCIFIIGIPVAIGIRHWIISNQPERTTVYYDPPKLRKLEKDTKPNPLKIHFNSSVAPLEQIGKRVAEGIRISPQIKGTWKWDQDNRLTFTPEEDWGVAQQYEVTLVKSLFPGHVRLKAYEVEFKTPAFEARISESRFYQDPTDPRIKRIVATVAFTHPVDTEDFEKRISMVQADKKGLFGKRGKPYEHSVTYNEFNGEAYIHSEPIEIPEDDTLVKLIIKGGVRSSLGGQPYKADLEGKVTVPGIYNFFRISSADLSLVRNKKNEPEQVLVIETTAGVRESELYGNLSAFVLPKDKPAVPGSNRKVRRDYYWGNPVEIGPEILELSEPMNLKPIPAAREYAKLHSFRVKVPENSFIYIRLKKGVKSFGDYVLAKEYDTIERMPKYPRELNIMSEGSVLSLSGDKKLSIVSRDIEAIRFEIGRVLPGQVNHLVSQTRGAFNNPRFVGYNFDESNIVKRSYETLPLQKLPHGKTQYSSVDLSGYLNSSGGSRLGLFFLKVEGWDPRRKRTTGVSDSRLVLITDLGVLVKDSADKTHDVFVMSMNRGVPVQGARVEVLGLNGQPIIGAVTDPKGHVRFPSLQGFKREKKPTVYLVRKGQDVSFIPYEKAERELNLSRFDIGGLHSGGKGDRLNAYLFSDRGIYRPGDTFHTGLIVKRMDWKGRLQGVPLEVAMSDPRGLEIKNVKFRLNSEGFHEFQYSTEENSPTGEYQVAVYIVKDNRRHSLLGTTTVRVEEFLPDRMKISSRFSVDRQRGWVSPEGLKAHVELMNLYGTPATDRRVAAEMETFPASPYFRKYKDYSFSDPMKAEFGFSDRLSDVRTDDTGSATFDLELDRFKEATYRLVFSAEGYEAEGGRAVLTQSSVLVSPLEFLVGYKPDGKLSYISKESERSVEFIAVDSGLDKVAVQGLTMKLMKQQYVSVLKKQPNGTYKYQSELKETTLKEEALSIPAEGLKYSLPTSEAGDFVLVVVNRKATELNRASFSVMGSENITRSLERDAELSVKLDKADYAPGDEIEISIRAPYIGAGLITIEKDRVYAWKWFRTTTTGSVQRIRVPSGLEGNGYINVSFVRALDSREIFMSPLSYGVKPFSVSLKRRDMGIVLDTPELARPGKPMAITYKAGRPGKAVIFAVDEGILQVAGYSTPDPLAHFFRKAALEVTTSQIVDQLLPEFSMVMAAATGGGEAFDEEALGKNLNPFKRKRQKPVAYWSGIVDVSNATRELVYEVPDHFNGKLRVMAVAVSEGAVGAASTSTLVRGHFVLSPNVPTFVAPADEFEISVNVANNVEESGKGPSVVLELETSEHLEILDEPRRIINIDEGREEVQTFSIRASSKLGSGSFTFTASIGSKSSKATVDLSVRPPTPHVTRLSAGYLKKGSEEVQAGADKYPHFRILEASVSHLPLGIAKGLTRFLDNYPHGCTEQIVSRAFPALVLRNKPSFGYSPERVEKSLERAMKILRSRQNAEGAFGFWAANSHVSDFQSAYATHFILDTADSGYPVNLVLKKRAMSYMRHLADNPGNTLGQTRVSAYAIYLLTRNGVVTTNQLTSLRTHVGEHFKKTWSTDLTGIYMAATYKMLRLDGKADSLIRNSSLGQEKYLDYSTYYDPLVRDAQLLYILANHFPDRLRKLKGEDILALVKPVALGRYNTISSSYTILALSAYADSVGNVSMAEAVVSELLAEGKERPLVLPQGLFPTVPFTPEASGIKIRSSSDNILFYQVTQAGFEVETPEKALTEGLEVQREYRSLEGKVLKSMQVGSEVAVHLKVRALKRDSIGDIAIVDLLPGGFEVVLDSDVRSNPKTTLRTDYVDVREDRVVVFAHVESSAKEFVYHIRATNKGSFTVPPIFAEAMYDSTVQALSLGDKMEVTGEQ